MATAKQMVALMTRAEDINRCRETERCPRQERNRAPVIHCC
jgi:hypothetical protein